MKKGLYRHYKGGLYHFITTALHTETAEELVIYMDSTGNTWARPKEMFLSTVEWEGVEVNRFEFVPVYRQKWEDEIYVPN